MKCLNAAANMKLFSSTRTQCRTAFAVLRVWLFAAASGVAKACRLQVSAAPGTQAHAAMVASALKGDPAAVSAGHLEAGDSQENDSRISASSCLKVCDCDSTALVKLRVGVDLSDPGMPLLIALVWNAAAAVVSGPCWWLGVQPSPGGAALQRSLRSFGVIAVCGCAKRSLEPCRPRPGLCSAWPYIRTQGAEASPGFASVLRVERMAFRPSICIRIRSPR